MPLDSGNHGARSVAQPIIDLYYLQLWTLCINNKQNKLYVVHYCTLIVVLIEDDRFILFEIFIILYHSQQVNYVFYMATSFYSFQKKWNYV